MDDKRLLIEEPPKNKTWVFLKLILVAIGLLLFLANILIIIFYLSKSPLRKSVGTEKACLTQNDKDQIIKSDVSVSNKTGWAEAARYLEQGIDFNTKPCDNFFQFMCGKYQNGSSLVDAWYRAYMERKKDMDKIAALDFAVTESSPRVMKQAKLIYDKCLNISSSGRGSIDYGLLVPFIEKLGGWPLVFQNLSDPDWNPFKFMGVLSSLSIDNIFSVRVMPNWKDHDKGNMIFVDQAETLIRKETYQKEGPDASSWIRQEIERFAQQMANFYGIKLDRQKFDNDVDIMLLIDYRLAMAKGTDFSEIHNYTNVYHEFDVKQAEEKWPDFDWEGYLCGVAGENFDCGKALNKTFNVMRPKFVDILSMLPMSPGNGARHAQNYLMYRFISGGYRLLPGYEAEYHKLEKEKEKKRWEPWQTAEQISYPLDRRDTCFKFVEKYLPWVVSRLYVEKCFDTKPGKPGDKLRMMTELVLDGFKEMIKVTPWMDDKTKFAANEKIFNVQKNIAYPEWIMDDELLDARHPESHLNILQDDHAFAMYVKLIKFQAWFTWHNFVEPVDRAQFSDIFAGSPWYEPWYNSINLPASSLYKPFLDVQYPMAVNLGAIGMLLGHELVHGFDNDGSQFDEIGRLRTWITKESYKGYNKMAKCLINQYDGYCYPKYNNICINGSLTLGENMADNGGLGAAYLGYKNYVEKFGPEPKLPGKLSQYTMDQVFFMAYSLIWCKDETHDPTGMIKGDVHAPFLYRMLGTLHDFPPFAKAFECKPGSGMVPKKTCKGWWH